MFRLAINNIVVLNFRSLHDALKAYDQMERGWKIAVLDRVGDEVAVKWPAQTSK